MPTGTCEKHGVDVPFVGPNCVQCSVEADKARIAAKADEVRERSKKRTSRRIKKAIKIENIYWRANQSELILSFIRNY